MKLKPNIYTRINNWLSEPVLTDDQYANIIGWLEEPLIPSTNNNDTDDKLPTIPPDLLMSRVTTNEPTLTTKPKTTLTEWLNEPLITLPEPTFISIDRPEYIYLQLTPVTSIRNYDSDKIVKLINSFYKNLLTRIQFYDKKLHIELATKVGYYIYMEKNTVEFYFIVPSKYEGAIRERISDTWKGITITQVTELPTFSNSTTSYKFDYKKEDALSLDTDARTNTLLASILNVLNVVETEDKVGVFYNFIPTSQYSWQASYNQTIEKYKQNVPIDKTKLSTTYILKLGVFLMLECIEMVLYSLTTVLSATVPDTKKTTHRTATDDTVTGLLKLQKMTDLSPATKNKKNDLVIRTQITVLSESKERTRMHNNARSVCQAYKTISGDNELIYKRTKPITTYTDYSTKDNAGMLLSPKECQNLLALPGRELLETFKCIPKIDTFESELPKELQEGTISIGTNTYRGSSQKAYLTSDKDLRNLALVLIGPTRAGKSTLITNIARDFVLNGECTIMFDFCGNCKLSDEVSACIAPDQILNITCDSFENLNGLGYNEISTFPAETTFLEYRNAKIQTSQLLTLVNSINLSDKELSAKMDRYLEAASLVVFISNGSVKDVFGVLQDHLIRAKFVRQVPETQHENMEEYIRTLSSLDDCNKEGEVQGTKLNLVAGIIDRISKFKQNTYMELMLKKSCDNNVNLVNEIQRNQLICIRMPEVMFATATEKDSYCTYWITKIWLALQIRNWHLEPRDHVKVNIIVDELYQVPHTQEFIKSKLSQMAKFTSKMIISCHYLGQIDIIRNELKAANSSYMLIAGCDKVNYKELSDELKPYTVEDLLNLKRYHSLNYIKYEEGYSSFITALPKPL